jgi:hypothetical protein
MDGVGLGGFSHGIVFPFVFDWREIADGRVAARRIVKAFDELKDRHSRLAVRPEATPIDQPAFKRCMQRLPKAIDVDDVIGLAGSNCHVEGVEHDAGLQIGRESPSDDASRPGVENDREVEKAANVGRKVISATHSSFGRSATKLRRTRSLAE